MTGVAALWSAVVIAAIVVGLVLAWTTRAVAEELRRSDDDPVDLDDDVDLTYRLDDWQTLRDLSARPTTPRGPKGETL